MKFNMNGQLKMTNGDHSIQLYFDNDGCINGSLKCSTNGCETCHEARDIWTEISFEAMRTTKLYQLNKIPVVIEWEDEEVWFTIKEI